MYVGKVEGTVVATAKDENLTGVKLLLVRVYEKGEPKNLIVAGDATRQAGIGDFVTLLGSKEAALLFRRPLCPVDAGITGFIDDFNEEL